VDLRTAGVTADININGVTVSSTTGDLQVIAGQSILTTTVTGTTTEFLTGAGGTLLLSADDAIGVTGNRIDTDLPIVAAAITGAGATGDIFINQVDGTTDPLEIGTATGLNGIANLSGITTANGRSIAVTTAAANGDLTITQAVTANGAGNVDLRTAGVTADININGVTVSSTTGDLQVIAGQSILTTTATNTTTEFLTGGGLKLVAVDAVGVTANRVDTNVGTVAAQITGGATTGDIFINEVAAGGALAIGTVAALNSQAALSGISTANSNDITVVTQSGSLTITDNVKFPAPMFVNTGLPAPTPIPWPDRVILLPVTRPAPATMSKAPVAVRVTLPVPLDAFTLSVIVRLPLWVTTKISLLFAVLIPDNAA